MNTQNTHSQKSSVACEKKGHSALAQNKKTASELWYYAKICRVTNVMRPDVEAIHGDAVIPGTIDANYPVLISDLPAPKIRTYPMYVESFFKKK